MGADVIELQSVGMSYPVPRRYRDQLLRPWADRRRVVALQDLELSVCAGSRIALLGPNGAGKSSVLRLIAGLLYPRAGLVRVNGFDTVKDNARVRGLVTLVGNDERSFYWRLTGTQNLRFFGALDEIPRKVLERRVPQLLGLVGLAGAGGRRVSDYSTGMRQRLSIARGLLREPDVLLLDEPTRSLDLGGGERIRALVNEVLERASSATLVLATNQMDDVVAHCNEVCIVHGGRIGFRGAVPAGGVEAVKQLYRSVVEPEIGGPRPSGRGSMATI